VSFREKYVSFRGKYVSFRDATCQHATIEPTKAQPGLRISH